MVLGAIGNAVKGVTDTVRGVTDLASGAMGAVSEVTGLFGGGESDGASGGKATGQQNQASIFVNAAKATKGLPGEMTVSEIKDRALDQVG